MNSCSTTFLCLCFSLAQSLHYISYTTHTITNCTKQPTHVLYLASWNYLAPLYHAFNATINPPTTSSITSSMPWAPPRTAAKRPWKRHLSTPNDAAAAVGGLHRRRHSRSGHYQCKLPRPSPTMAAAASIVSIACAFQTLNGFLVSGGTAHTPCDCACTLYSPNYQNTPGFRLSCS